MSRLEELYAKFAEKNLLFAGSVIGGSGPGERGVWGERGAEVG